MKFKKVIAGAVIAATMASMASIGASAASYSSYQKGDVDGDGWVTTHDIGCWDEEYKRIQDISSEKGRLEQDLECDTNFYCKYYFVLDTDGNGKVNKNDRSKLVKAAKYSENCIANFGKKWDNYDVNRDYIFLHNSTYIPVVNSTDTKVVRECVLSNAKYAKYKLHADVNRDGKLTATDTMLTAKKASEYKAALESLKSQTCIK